MADRLLPRRAFLPVAGVVVAVCLAAVPLALASHLFTDVPDSNPFHDDITAVRGAGITSGKTCNPPGTPPTYCPTEPITREAMAAFLHRGLSRVAHNAFGGSVTATPTSVATVTVTVGGAPGGTQFVQLVGVVTTGVGSPNDCPCNTKYFITRDGAGQVGITHYQTNTGAVGTVAAEHVSGGVAAVAAVPTASTQTFHLDVAREGPAFSAAVTAQGNLTAVTVAFGASGQATLSAAESGDG